VSFGGSIFEDSHSIIQSAAIFDLYFVFITLISFPSGIPMHFSAHQTQQQLAGCERSSLRCDHESHSQSGPLTKQRSQNAVFWGSVPSDAPLRGNLGEVCCIHCHFPRGSLELRGGPRNSLANSATLSYLLATVHACPRTTQIIPSFTPLKLSPAAAIYGHLSEALKSFSRPPSGAGHPAIIKSTE